MARIVSSRIRRPSVFARNTTIATQNQARSDKLSADLTRLIANSQYHSPTARRTIANTFVSEALGIDPYQPAIRAAFPALAANLVGDALTTLYVAPQQVVGNEPLAAYNLRNQLSDRAAFFAAETDLVSNWRQDTTQLLQHLARALPQHRPQAPALTFKAPLISLVADPVQVIDRIVRTLCAQASDPHDPTPRPGQSIGDAILKNILTVSRLPYDKVAKDPQRIKWPADQNATPQDLIEQYLSGTPFLQFFTTEVDLIIDRNTLCEMVHIIAPPGHGKTQLCQSLILQYLDHPERPGLFIQDSQADMLNVISQLQEFHPDFDDRFIFLSPADQSPPTLNLFGWNRTLAERLNNHDRIIYLETVIQSLMFVARALLGTEFTGKMQSVFRYLSTWILQIEGADIHTVIRLLDDPSEHLDALEELPPNVQEFITQLYEDKSIYAQTRQHIKQRLQHLVSHQLFERIFANSENKFDLGAALNDGKVVFVDTAKSTLQPEWSSMFGKFWISQLLQAALARNFIQRNERRLAVAIIDEAHEYFSGAEDQIETLLYQGRKLALPLHIIHQDVAQLKKHGVFAPVTGVPAVRLAGKLPEADASALARNMHTTPEFLMSPQKTSSHAEWSLFVRNLTPTATTIKIPFLQAERRPRMPAEAYQRLLERNRRLVSNPDQTRTYQPRPNHQPNDNDGDSY